MHPVRKAVLHDARHDDRARRIGETALFRLAQDRHVPRANDASEEVTGIGDARLCFTLERRAEQADGDVRGKLAVQVPAEAVGHGHQHARRSRPATDAILVDAPGTDACFLYDGEFHIERFIWS